MVYAVGDPGHVTVHNDVDGLLTGLRTDVDAKLDISAASGTYVAVTEAPYTPHRAGLKGDGTDETTAFNAMLQTVFNAGGGDILFDQLLTYRCDGQIVVPDDGTGVAHSKVSQGVPITLRGLGPAWDGNYSGLAKRGPTLDLRYAGGGMAKLVGKGNGSLEVSGLTFANLGTADSTPYIFGTNPRWHIHDNAFLGHSSKSGVSCNQDAIRLGGTGGLVGSDDTDIFQGYGTVIERNMFDRIRCAMDGHTSVNALIVQNNLLTTKCGSDATSAAFQLNGTGLQSVGNMFYNNIVEVQYYTYAVRMVESSNNVFIGNGYWDYGTGQLLAVYKSEGQAAKSGHHLMLDAEYSPSIISLDIIEDISGITSGTGAKSAKIVKGGLRNAIVDPNGGTATMQSTKALPADTSTLYQILRSTAESTNPNAQLLAMFNNGVMKLLGPSASCYFGPSGVIVSMDGSVQRNGTGALALYGGSDAGNAGTIRAMRGLFRDNAIATASRPSAATVGAGACYFDTTLNKPVWSTGSGWVDASGAAV